MQIVTVLSPQRAASLITTASASQSNFYSVTYTRQIFVLGVGEQTYSYTDFESGSGSFFASGVKRSSTFSGERRNLHGTTINKGYWTIDETMSDQFFFSHRIPNPEANTTYNPQTQRTSTTWSSSPPGSYTITTSAVIATSTWIRADFYDTREVQSIGSVYTTAASGSKVVLSTTSRTEMGLGGAINGATATGTFISYLTMALQLYGGDLPWNAFNLHDKIAIAIDSPHDNVRLVALTNTFLSQGQYLNAGVELGRTKVFRGLANSIPVGFSYSPPDEEGTVVQHTDKFISFPTNLVTWAEVYGDDEYTWEETYGYEQEVSNVYTSSIIRTAQQKNLGESSLVINSKSTTWSENLRFLTQSTREEYIQPHNVSYLDGTGFHPASFAETTTVSKFDDAYIGNFLRITYAPLTTTTRFGTSESTFRGTAYSYTGVEITAFNDSSESEIKEGGNVGTRRGMTNNNGNYITYSSSVYSTYLDVHLYKGNGAPVEFEILVPEGPGVFAGFFATNTDGYLALQDNLPVSFHVSNLWPSYFKGAAFAFGRGPCVLITHARTWATGDSTFGWSTGGAQSGVVYMDTGGATKSTFSIGFRDPYNASGYTTARTGGGVYKQFGSALLVAKTPVVLFGQNGARSFQRGIHTLSSPVVRKKTQEIYNPFPGVPRIISIQKYYSAAAMGGEEGDFV